MTNPSGSSCVGIKVPLQAHLVLEESAACIPPLSGRTWNEKESPMPLATCPETDALAYALASLSGFTPDEAPAP
jgi:hypothetical protein